jgi:hypothetical protein
MKAFSGVVPPRGMLARVENQRYARRNARQHQNMLQGGRLGVVVFMMKGCHGRISLNRSIARCSKRSICSASCGGGLWILHLDPGFRRSVRCPGSRRGIRIFDFQPHLSMTQTCTARPSEVNYASRLILGRGDCKLFDGRVRGQ